MTRKPPTPAELQIAVDKFNEAFPVGTVVTIHHAMRGIYMDHKVTHGAYIMGGHSAVAFFEGVSGCYDISHVKGKAS